MIVVEILIGVKIIDVNIFEKLILVFYNLIDINWRQYFIFFENLVY